MAGGKQSPRQKMINLMYLVFIAMIAMKMDKEVLSAFGFMNDKLTVSNSRTEEKNSAAYEALALKASEQAKQYGKAKQKTDSLRVISNDLYSYIETLKTDILKNEEDKSDYESMDKTQVLDELFFKSGKHSARGDEFISKINDFRNTAVSILGKRELSNSVKERFSTEGKTNKDGLKVDWLEYHYEGFPLVASLTNFTQMQADIKVTEADALSALLQKELSDAVSMTNYDAMVIFDKNAYYAGEKLSGKIVLGKNDPNLTAERVVLNGRDIDKSKIQAGQVILDGSVGGVGDKTLKGSFFFKENDSLVEIPISGYYSVIPRPNEAVISADRMNVVYKGLTNPMTISIPGIPSNKVTASAPGLTRKNGSTYTMRPTGKGGTDVTIRVSGKLPDGKPVSSNKKFRIKDIPAAMGMVRGKTGIVKMPKSSAVNANVAAGLPDFLFDLKLQVLSFKVKVPGQLATIVGGANVNAKAKALIAKARRGDLVTFYDIKAKVSNSSYQLKEVLPVQIEITN